jgi:hypothetical protein
LKRILALTKGLRQGKELGCISCTDKGIAVQKNIMNE